MLKKLAAAVLSLALAASLGLAAPAAQAHGYHCTQKSAACAYADTDGDGVCDYCGRRHVTVRRPQNCGKGRCGTSRRGWHCR